MKTISHRALVALFALCVTLASTAQQGKKTGVLQGDELQKVVPTSYFFEGQVAPVQMRNAVAIRTADGKIVAAGLVDSSGYSSAIAEKYQGFLITSKKVSIEGQTLPPGQYGFGFTNDGKFRVMDAGANDVFLAPAHTDDKLQRAVPLKAVASGSDYRLYAGKKYVTLKVQ
jgi:hypothetical protein